MGDASFEDKQEEALQAKRDEELFRQQQMMMRASAEEMKKKQAKKNEDPRITRFKGAEVVVSKSQPDIFHPF